MMQMLRKKACSRLIEYLAHVTATDCLVDCLTKSPTKPEALIKAVSTGILQNQDVHPPCRSLLKHKAYIAQWLRNIFCPQAFSVSFLGDPSFSLEANHAGTSAFRRKSM